MAKIYVSFTIVSTSNFFLIAREDGAPLAEVYRSPVLSPPHIIRNITIPNVNPVMHRVELWDTLDGVNPSQLRGRCDIDASQNSQTGFDLIQFIVGRGFGAPIYDPAGYPNTVYSNPNLKNKSYVVLKPDFGALLWGTHIVKILDSGGNETGGFGFVNGQFFSDGEEYTILVANTQTSSATSGAGYPDGIVTLTSNTTFATNHYRKMLEIDTATNTTITISNLDTIPENTVFGINTHSYNGPNFHNCILKLPTSRFIVYRGSLIDTLYVGRAEEVSFIKQGTLLRIVNWDGDHRRIGEIVQGEGGDAQPVNSIPLTGGWYLQTDYPRLFNWYVSKINPLELGSGFTDDEEPNIDQRVKWIIGVNKFWVPDHGGYFYRALDSDGNIDPDGAGRQVNYWQTDENKMHNHVLPPWNKAGSKASESGGNTPAGIDNNNLGTEYRVGAMTDGEWTDATITPSGAAEARPKNLARAGYVIC